MSMTRTADPSSEPVSLSEARDHLRLDTSGSPPSHADDTLVQNLIQAAREWCETYTGRSFFEQTWKVQLDEFPEVIRLPRPPIISVTSIQYVDTSGDTQTLSSSIYRVDAEGARITEAYSQVWPDTRDVTNAVTVTYKAGYDSGNSPQDASAIPQAIKQAILLLVGQMYEHREDVIVGTTVTPMAGNGTVRALLSPYLVDKYGATV